MRRKWKSYCFIFLLSLMGGAFAAASELNEIQWVEKPFQSGQNDYYVSNQAPLQPSALIKLPVGSIKPNGWLLSWLERQRDGLTGHLGEISAWLQKEDNAWLSNDGRGAWGWEELPYWLKGYANIGYILEDEKMIAESMLWIEGVLNSQRENGDFGPLHYVGIRKRDYWGNMIMLYCLQSYYEYSSDERVLELMTRYFEYQLTVPDRRFLEGYWQKVRGGDNLYSVIWLYNRTGNKKLLELAEKIHRNSSDWISRDIPFKAIQNNKSKRRGHDWPKWFNNLTDWHNVNVAQCFREPAQYWQLSGDSKHLNATYEIHSIIREHFGQMPGGMFGGDENCRPGYDDPRQGIETCGIVEQMNSDEHLLRITGDSFWGDHLEEVAFNTYPAAVMPDFKSLHYVTAPNMVKLDRHNHHPSIDNKGPFLMMNPFSSRCCQHNHAQGWPYFVENLWMATADNGVCAVAFSASELKAKVGSGKVVTIKQETHYPFEENVNMMLSLEGSETFPLYLRIPSWCEMPRLSINGVDINLYDSLSVDKRSGYLRINRVWSDRDKIKWILPMEISINRWEKNHNSASVQYGPLTFSLLIDSKKIKFASDETAIWDSKWQDGVDTKLWPSWEIHPVSDWNIGLILGKGVEQFELIRAQWPKDNFPFTPASTPIRLKMKGKKIKEWEMDETGLCGELMDSPVSSDEPIQDITMIPMGAARLRISAFPVIKEN